MKTLLTILGSIGLTSTGASATLALSPTMAIQSTQDLGDVHVGTIPYSWISERRWEAGHGAGASGTTHEFKEETEQQILWKDLELKDFDSFKKATSISIQLKDIHVLGELGDKNEENAWTYEHQYDVVPFNPIWQSDSVLNQYISVKKLMDESNHQEAGATNGSHNEVSAEIFYKITTIGITIKLEIKGSAHGTWSNWCGAGGQLSWNGGLQYVIVE